MARPRRRVKRKFEVEAHKNVKLVETSRKRRHSQGRTLMNITHSEDSFIQCKKKRTRKNKIRRSKSVILVGETPCCQSPEQVEKYTKLGLNSALFLKGSQCPRRRQSHISVITISSDDEETSEERTNQWVSTINNTTQFSRDPEESKESLRIVDNVAEVHEEPTHSTEDLRRQMSLLFIPETSEQTLCVSAPVTAPICQFPTSTPENEKNISINNDVEGYNGFDSTSSSMCFTNPLKIGSEGLGSMDVSVNKQNNVGQMTGKLAGFYFGQPNISNTSSVISSYMSNGLTFANRENFNLNTEPNTCSMGQPEYQNGEVSVNINTEEISSNTQTSDSDVVMFPETKLYENP